VARLRVGVLADLEAPHLIVMRRLTEAASHPEYGEQGWTRGELTPALPELGVTLDAVLATLERWTPCWRPWSETVWWVT